ncbi:hypothetical protein HYALB_00003122 [Hymenoscyphus albidus]|uniref:DOMON domain-containing protein n=1 Tax=Hymenoscyphus albidus TaxID=595503 RepID=A0A9N9Q1G2_9HELO|nr:hypothetical protein HYALB_00003122 [Hymenoscyphus albidus]
MRFDQSFGLAAATFGIDFDPQAPLTSALATFSPSSNGPSYSVGIPSNSAISTTSQGGIYFSLSAPTSYSWVGLGIGEQMAGASIFVMYADGNNNVTISGRAGKGHVQPQVDNTLQGGLTLLEGSGIVNGKMVANVHCTTCRLSSDRTSTSSPWIAAWSQGAALNTKSPSATINQHSAYQQLTLDLTQATMNTDSNPFVGAAAAAASGTSTSGEDNTNRGRPGSGGPGSDDNRSGVVPSPNSGATVVGQGAARKAQDRQKAHGILMGVAVVILFPLGAIFMRLGVNPWIHAGIQLVSYTLMIAGMAIGIIFVNDVPFLTFKVTHFAFGLAIVALLFLQPFFGLAHHFLYVRRQSRTPISYVHIWYGRALMLLAVINGGLGLKLANNSRGGKIAYGVVAGIMGVAYIAVVILKRKGSAPRNAIKHERTRDSAS